MASSKTNGHRTRTGPKLEHQSQTITIPEDRAFNVVVVADTHSHPHPNTEALIRELKADWILHAGDIGDLNVLKRLAKLAPLSAVRGNIDERAPGLPDSMDIELRTEDRSILRLLLIHIAVYGPKLRADVSKLATSHQARLVLCGHSHVPFMGRDKGLGMFNPGSIGPRRFQLPITLGVLQVSTAGIGLRHVSCETGKNWTP